MLVDYAHVVSLCFRLLTCIYVCTRTLPTTRPRDSTIKYSPVSLRKHSSFHSSASPRRSNRQNKEKIIPSSILSVAKNAWDSDDWSERSERNEEESPDEDCWLSEAKPTKLDFSSVRT